jgi:hypothetical protein
MILTRLVGLVFLAFERPLVALERGLRRRIVIVMDSRIDGRGALRKDAVFDGCDRHGVSSDASSVGSLPGGCIDALMLLGAFKAIGVGLGLRAGNQRCRSCVALGGEKRNNWSRAVIG